MSLILRNDATPHVSESDRVQHNNALLSFHPALEYADLAGGNRTRSKANPKASTASANKVAVILGFYNGQAHVAEQLRSIF